MTAAAVVLAAGAGRRFGGAKAAAELGGRPLVAHAVEAARASGIGRVVVVVGAQADVVAAAVPSGADVEVVRNDRWEQGQSTSLAAGLAALGDGVDVAVVLLADQPGIEPAAITGVVARVRGGAEAARVRHDDGPSHPVALARRVWPRLAAVSGDVGARAVFGALDLAEVRVAGPVARDVDTRGDLDAARTDGY